MKVIVGWKRKATIDKYTCEQCKNADGQPINDPSELVDKCCYYEDDEIEVVLWCRCKAVPVFEEQDDS